MTQFVGRLWKNHKGMIIFIAAMLLMRGSIADWNPVPTGSMKPTILEGDVILVNKSAYNINLPFTHTSLLKVSDPQAGDVIVFDSKANGLKMVKRVIGVPGDVISMQDNVLTINGQRLDYELVNIDSASFERIETLNGIQHAIRHHHLGSPLSSFSAVRVPEGMYLAMGDNRDNSSDSRVIGYIPRDEIIGRSQRLLASFDVENYYLPRWNRFGQRLFID